MADQRPSMMDPYRALGLEPGAAMADVKRAYRRLAKAYHPDSAGEGALPRFLAIHEAYEAIRTGRPMTPGRRSANAARPAAPSAEPWRADPDRARAAREQARRRAGTRAAGGATGAGSGAGTGTRASGGPRTSGQTGSSGSAGGRASSKGASARTGTSGEARGGSRGRRHVRKATMGSTSYDEARDATDPNDPTWSGASWYGPSTGEYWIINPREYADPRKHGPEYQSRARRMAAAAAMGEAAAGAEADGELDTDDIDTGDIDAPDLDPRAARRTASGEAAWTVGTQAGRPASRGRAEPEPQRRRPARDSWSRSGGQARNVGVRGGRAGTSPNTADWGATWPSNPRSAGRDAGRRLRAASARELVGGPADDPVRRLGIALVAWPPIGLAAAALIGDVTGCAAFAADCGGTEPMLPWLAQAVILGLLLLLPPIARILAGGAIGVLVALVPLTAFLVAVGGTGAPQAGFALAFLLGLAWLLGIAWAVAQVRRGVARAAP